MDIESGLCSGVDFVIVGLSFWILQCSINFSTATIRITRKCMSCVCYRSDLVLIESFFSGDVRTLPEELLCKDK
jgi:hypothetical protein